MARTAKTPLRFRCPATGQSPTRLLAPFSRRSGCAIHIAQISGEVIPSRGAVSPCDFRRFAQHEASEFSQCPPLLGESFPLAAGDFAVVAEEITAGGCCSSSDIQWAAKTYRNRVPSSTARQQRLFGQVENRSGENGADFLPGPASIRSAAIAPTAALVVTPCPPSPTTQKNP